MPGQPARAERARGARSRAGLMAAPAFKPKLKSTNRNEPKIEVANERARGARSRAGLMAAPAFRPKLKSTNRNKPKLEIANEVPDRVLGWWKLPHSDQS